jgi:hypothetical protein
MARNLDTTAFLRPELNLRHGGYQVAPESPAQDKLATRRQSEETLLAGKSHGEKTANEIHIVTRVIGYHIGTSNVVGLGWFV